MHSQYDMLQDFLHEFEEELSHFAEVDRRADFDELERIFRRMQANIVTHDPQAASDREVPPLYDSGRDARPPTIQSGEVTTPEHERQASPKLREEAQLGWLDRRGRHRRVQPGRRGVATVNPDGSVDYTVFNQALNHVLWRRRILRPDPSRAGLTPQQREDLARNTVARLSRQALRPHSAQDVGPDLLPARRTPSLRRPRASARNLARPRSAASRRRP